MLMNQRIKETPTSPEGFVGKKYQPKTYESFEWLDLLLEGHSEG